ncbi:glycosyltransferase [Kitasatospora sp. NPDC056184]|uniref:glycosyltransferase n=1 Tax=Kitasatospora sp. NPDC056184 TaxID=3345738 RepID=UPI0035DE0651
MLIPRIFHQVWLGGPMPERFRAYSRGWQERHPDWEYRLWTEEELDPSRSGFLTHGDAFLELESWSEKSDVARFEILLRCGGIYIDTDFECLRPLDGLLADQEAFAASEDGVHISTGIMGAVPGHPFMAACVQELPLRMKEFADANAALKTGPGLATAVFERQSEQAGRPPVTVFSSDLFYPYHFTEPHRAGEEFPGAYAVHHWAASWM